SGGFSGNAMGLRLREAVSVGSVTQHELNRRAQLIRFNGVDDRLKIGAVAGNEDSNGNFSWHKIYLCVEADAPVAFPNFTDHKMWLAPIFERLCNRADICFSDNENHPEPVIKSLVHFILGDPTELLNQAKNRRRLRRVAIDPSSSPFGQDPREVSGNSTAGDMSGALDAIARKQRSNNSGIDARRCQQ